MRLRLNLGFLGLAGLVLVALSGFAAPSSKKRTALVVGNSHYEATIGPLRNPIHDAKAMAKTLKSLGFEVLERHDLNRDQLLKAVDLFRKTLPGAEVGLFYYAGHGISIQGSNYLIPLKSGFTTEGADAQTLRMQAETRLFNAEQAVADMSASGATCNLIILDACRTNALAQIVRTRSLTSRGGLSEMTPPAGSLIAFSTDAGQTALDGTGVNGLYTGELIQRIQTPGLTVEQVFKRTRASVMALSEGKQLPAEYSRLVGDDIYLAGKVEPSDQLIRSELCKALPVGSPVPTASELQVQATNADPELCLKTLQSLAQNQGQGEYAIVPISTLLVRVKNQLAKASPGSKEATTVESICTKILEIIPMCLPPGKPETVQLTAKAFNRRGDALLLLGRSEEALSAFNEALRLTPEDPYIVYNRGVAYEKMGNPAAAKADFIQATAPRFRKSEAYKLAQKALEAMAKKK